MPMPATAAPPENAKRSNAPTIPPRFDDEVWRLSKEERKGAGEIADAINAKEPSLKITRYSVIRRVNALENERQAFEQSVSLQQSALQAGSEAAVALERLRLQYGDVIEHLFASWEDSNREEVAFDCKVSTALRGAIREHSRTLAEAQKTLIKAEELKLKAEQAKWRRSLQGDRERVREETADLRDSLRRDEGVGADPSPPESSVPEGDSFQGPSEEEFFDPRPTFTIPAGGAVLRKKPDAYCGKGEPLSKVMVTVDEQVFNEVPVDKNGVWRLIGAQVLGLKPGKHLASVAKVLDGGRLGLATAIWFTLLSLFLAFVPMTASANEISLAVNGPISRSCGLVRPRNAFLRDPPCAESDPADGHGGLHQPGAQAPPFRPASFPRCQAVLARGPGLTPRALFSG